MKKILYIHHGGELGGAPRSLSFLINDLDKNCNLLTSEDFPVGEIEKFKEYIIRGRDIINRELVNFKK